MELTINVLVVIIITIFFVVMLLDIATYFRVARIQFGEDKKIKKQLMPYGWFQAVFLLSIIILFINLLK